MHELTICLSLIRILEKQVAQEKKIRHRHLHQIKTLWLEIGDLAGIELDALRFSFPVAASRSIAKNATLEIIPVAGRAWCDGCQNSVTLKTQLDPCPLCGQYDYRITQGKELRIVKMEVE